MQLEVQDRPRLQVKDVISFLRNYEPKEKRILQKANDGDLAITIARSIHHNLFVHTCDYCGNITGVAFGKMNRDGSIHIIGICINTKQVSLKKFISLFKDKIAGKVLTAYRKSNYRFVRYIKLTT